MSNRKYSIHFIPLTLGNACFSIGILCCILLYSCTQPIQSPGANSFKNDSLKVWQLLDDGSALYARRNSMEQIGGSLLYFDSANRLAQQLGDKELLANTLYYIGNVYNAWNGEPEKTADYYQKSTALFSGLPGTRMRIKEFYLRYLIAHTYDKEKGNDSSKSIATLKSAFADVRKLRMSAQDSMIYLTDYAWVASNAGNYAFAETILDSFTRRPVNDPESNNYLDHYYITKARIDIFKYARISPYTDSIVWALGQGTNKFDSAYLTISLAKLYYASRDFKQAYYYSNLNSKIQGGIVQTDILSTLRTQLLNSQLLAEKEREKQNQEKIKIKNLFLAAIALLLIIVILIFLLYSFYEKRKQVQNQVKQQEAFTLLLLQNEEVERQRIAMELHDGINHELLGLKNNIVLGKQLETLEVENIIRSVREVSRNLYPSLFENVGLPGSVQSLCTGMTEAGFFTTCEINYTSALSPRDELQLYRIIQEALQNAARHAKAEACKITILSKHNKLITEIKDNGIGFDSGVIQTNSFGLQSMQQRAKAINAQIELKSSSKGTVITITKIFP